MLKYFILFFITISSAHSNVNYNFGTFVPYFNKMQVSDSGAFQTFDFNPYIGIGTNLRIKGNNFFLPEAGYTFFTTTAKKTNKSIFFLKYNFGYYLKKFNLRYGFTTHWYRIGGDGGTVTLNNGSGQSDFKAPSTTKTTYFTTVDLGIEYFLGKSFGARFDLNTMGINNSDKMAFNYLLSINYYR